MVSNSKDQQKAWEHVWGQGSRPPRKVEGCSPPLASAPQGVPRWAPGGPFQALPVALQRVPLPAPLIGVPGGGVGAEPGAHHPAAAVHGPEPARGP
jgi:hypothetical protein